MTIYDVLHDRQSQPGPTHLTGPVGIYSIESFRQSWNMHRIDPLARILNL